MEDYEVDDFAELNDEFAPKPSWKPEVGDTIIGRVVSADIRQVTNFTTKAPEFFRDGTPKKQAVICLDVKGDSSNQLWLYPKSFAYKALGDAVRAAGGMKAGAWLLSKRIDDLPAPRGQGFASKQFKFAVFPDKPSKEEYEKALGLMPNANQEDELADARESDDDSFGDEPF